MAAKEKWIFKDEWPDDVLKVVGEITIAAGQLDYVLYLSYNRASGKEMAVGMPEAEKLQTFKRLSKELKKAFKELVPDAEPNTELKEILHDVRNIYEKRHSVIHGVFVETSVGQPGRFYSDKARNVRVKAINYGVVLEELVAIRDELRGARNILNSFTKKWLLGKRARKRRECRS